MSIETEGGTACGGLIEAALPVVMGCWKSRCNNLRAARWSALTAVNMFWFCRSRSERRPLPQSCWRHSFGSEYLREPHRCYPAVMRDVRSISTRWGAPRPLLQAFLRKMRGLVAYAW